MKKSEIIRKYYNEIAKALAERYRAVIESDGSIQYKVYIWEDGELQFLEGVQGDTGYLVPRDMETRELYFVHTVEAPCFNAWDYTDHGEPEDADEREAEHREIVDFLVDEYNEQLDDLMDSIISEAEMDERCGL